MHMFKPVVFVWCSLMCLCGAGLAYWAVFPDVFIQCVQFVLVCVCTYAACVCMHVSVFVFSCLCMSVYGVRTTDVCLLVAEPMCSSVAASALCESALDLIMKLQVLPM